MPGVQVERAWLLENVAAVAPQLNHATGRRASATTSVRLEFHGIRGGNSRFGTALYL